MDAPPAGLPQASFAPQAQHLEYARYPTVRGREPHYTHLDSHLQLDEPFAQHFDPHLAGIQYGQQYLPSQLYASPTTPIHQQIPEPHRVQELPSHSGPPRQEVKSNQFPILPTHLNDSPSYASNETISRLRQEAIVQPSPVQSNHGQTHTPSHGLNTASVPAPKQGGHFPGMQQIPNPPHLDAWRQKLFDVDEPITLTEQEFQIYFPHVDNVYSHRSTQRYKRQPFVSHYWDCRLKGRPPGTPKSDDPNKRKRKRQARERDLCDVKIKITEFFENARQQLGNQAQDLVPDHDTNVPHDDPTAHGLPPNGLRRGQQPGEDGQRYYTIQRVNGNGGNGKGDGVAGPHKHTLEDSDNIKKNSIQRAFVKEAKEKKKTEKTYHKKATGAALATVRKHSKEDPLKLYASCFCPFVQRVWISLELKGISYQYIEIDPYNKTPEFLAINPRGLIPALRHDDWNCYESSVLMEYLEDLHPDKHPLLPSDAKGRGYSRLWADHINRKLIPAFYHILKAQEAGEQAKEAANIRSVLDELINAADPQGPFFLGDRMTFVDVHLAPWLLRFRRVLQIYRGWPAPEPGSRWAKWVEAIEADDPVRRTTSGDDLYKDSYERYAENRPGTSQVADAVNSGRGLP